MTYRKTFDVDGLEDSERRIQDRAHLLRVIADADLVGIGLGTLDGRVELANDEMLRLMGVSRSDYEAGRVEWDARIAPESREEHRQTMAVVREGKVARYQCSFQHPDGEHTHFVGAGVLLDDGSGSYVSVAVDVTEQQRSKRAIEEASRHKDRFLAVLAHELRGPLATARLALASLGEGGPSQPERAQRILERQVEHLTHLTRQLDDVARIGANKLHLDLRTLNVTAFARAVVEDHTPLYENAGVRLDGPPPEGDWHVRADETRLRQCLANLLTNAVKFTQRGGRVTVEVESHGEFVILRVSDDGEGLEAAQMDRLFDPFEQRASTLRYGQAGLGLGLAIVQGIIDLHDGVVSVASDGNGCGTTFEIRLPAHSITKENESP